MLTHYTSNYQLKCLCWLCNVGRSVQYNRIIRYTEGQRMKSIKLCVSFQLTAPVQTMQRANSPPTWQPLRLYIEWAGTQSSNLTM